MFDNPKTTTYVILFLCLATILNVVFTTKHRYETRNSSKEYYSYVGDDFPLTLPVRNMGQVTMTIEESQRFRLQTDPSIPQTWVSNLPQGIGFVRLGPQKRVFAISMYHELHCLLEIHQVIVSRTGPNKHVQHCLNYIRQGVLCSADLTLEPGSYLERNYTRGLGAVIGDRVCKDWRAVHRFAEENYEEWEEFRRQNVLRQ